MRRGAGGSASLASSSTTKTGTTPKAACSTSCSKTRASFRSPSTRAGVASASSDSASSSSAFNRARLERSRCSAAASSGLADKPVAESTNRLDPAPLLQSAPDLVRRLLDAVVEACIVRAPNLLEQLRTRHNLTWAPGEQLQHHAQPPLELHGSPAQPRLAAGHLHPQPSAP